MFRLLLLALAGIGLSMAAAPAAEAQTPDWAPPSRQMPQMPRMPELTGDWLSPRSGWFRGVEQLSGVSASGLRASGEPRPGSDVAQIARFSSGPLPVVVWSDRNGDSRADMIEMYRRGGVIIQLIDADYDGGANVLRIYDASGGLVREEPM